MKVVTVLMREDCENGPRAAAQVKRLAEELGIVVRVDEVLLRSEAEALRERFLGSPTVRVGGQDVEVGARSHTSYALT